MSWEQMEAASHVYKTTDNKQSEKKQQQQQPSLSECRRHLCRRESGCLTRHGAGRTFKGHFSIAPFPLVAGHGLLLLLLWSTQVEKGLLIVSLGVFLHKDSSR